MWIIISCLIANCIAAFFLSVWVKAKELASKELRRVFHEIKYPKYYQPADYVEKFKRDFSAIFQHKQRPDSIEITTPYNVNQNVVSVFIRRTETGYVVDDNGWLFDGLYNQYNELTDWTAVRAGLQAHKLWELDEHRIGRKVDDFNLLTAAAYDLAHFIQASVLLHSYQEAS